MDSMHRRWYGRQWRVQRRRTARPYGLLVARCLFFAASTRISMYVLVLLHVHGSPYKLGRLEMVVEIALAL